MAARAATSTAKKTATTRKTAATPHKKVVRTRKNAVAPGASASVIDDLHAYIPSPDVARNYVGRKVWGVWDAVLAEQAMNNGENILLEGDTGSGKTLFGEAFASKHRMMYYSLPCDVSIDPSALFGRMQPTDTPGKFRWQDGPVTQVIRGECGRGAACDDPNCKGGVFNISEVNFMPPKIAASVYPLLDGRRYIPLLGHEGEVVRAHPRTLIIADMNPFYRGTMQLNAAFRNRFDYKIPWNYSDEVEEKLVKFPTMRGVAKKIRDMRDTEINTPCSTNMLMEFERIAMNPVLGLDFAMHNFAAAFAVNEQQAVTKVLELEQKNLERDMAFLSRKSASRKKPSDDEDLEEVDFEYETEEA